MIRDQPSRIGKSNPVYALSSHSEMAYAWDYPAARDKKILLSIRGAQRRVDVMEIGDLMPFNFNVINLDLFHIWPTHKHLYRMVNAIKQSPWTFALKDTNKYCASLTITSTLVFTNQDTEPVPVPSVDKTASARKPLRLLLKK